MTLETQPKGRLARFGVYEADIANGELRKHGIRIKLQTQPFELLSLLIERAGEVVTREEIRKRLWPADTFVDFDNSLNAAATKLRDALSDNAHNPRFIETLPRRGYRFLASVDWLEAPKSSGSFPIVEAAPAAPAQSPGLSTEPPPAANQAEPGPGYSAEGFSAATTTSGGARGSGTFATATGLPRRWLHVAVVGVALVIVLAAALYFPRPSHAPATAGSRIMLAVLPFENLTNERERDYFVIGLTDELIAKLGAVSPQRLGVIARSSVLRLRESPKTVPEIARDLNVQYIVEGSVRSMGTRVRVTMQLVKASDQTQLWSLTKEGSLGDVFSLQTECARQVASALALQLLPGEAEALERAATTSMDAYEAYLRGRFAWNKRTELGLDEARAHFDQALKMDPNYTLAWVGLADVHNLNGGYGFVAPAKTFPAAKEAAQRALQLEPNLSQAHAALGFSHLYFDWDWPQSELEFRRAIETNPNNSQARLWYAQLLRSQNRLDEAAAEMRKAAELDPIAPVIKNYTGWIEFTRRDYASAVGHFQRALDSSPDWGYADVSMAYALAQAGKNDEAIAYLRNARKLTRDRSLTLEALSYVLARAGQRAEAESLLKLLLSPQRKQRYSPYNIAMTYVALGEHGKAYEWLEKAYFERDPWMVWLKVHPEWDPVRSDPRFVEFLRRLKFTP